MTKCLFRTSLVWLLATGCSITVLLLPAIWNGFPLVFADTGGYLERPFQGDLGIGRSALYGAFLAAGIPLQFWPNVVIQAGVTLWILRLVLRIHRAGDRPSVFIAVIIGLCLLTSLPWYVSQLMPDIFLPLAMLAAYILAFAPGELTRTEKTALVLFIGIAIAFHMSILALVVALLVLDRPAQPIRALVETADSGNRPSKRRADCRSHARADLQSRHHWKSRLHTRRHNLRVCPLGAGWHCASISRRSLP